MAEKNAEVSKLRFFCMGKELKDDLFLYSYEMSDNIVVQAMLRQWWADFWQAGDFLRKHGREDGVGEAQIGVADQEL